MSFDGWISLSDPQVYSDLNQFNQGFRNLAQKGIRLDSMHSYLAPLALAIGVTSIYEQRSDAKSVSYAGQHWQFGYVIGLDNRNSFVILQPNFEMEEGSFEVLMKDAGDEEFISLLMHIFIGLLTQRYYSLFIQRPQISRSKER